MANHTLHHDSDPEATRTPAIAPPVELWRGVVGFPYYEVSNHGRIRRVGRPTRQTNPERILKTVITRKPNGHPMRVSASLYKEGSKKWNVMVHQIVAGAFIGPRPAGKSIAHLDGDITHNYPDNLAYCSVRENHAHKLIHGTHMQGEAHVGAHLKVVDVEIILLNYTPYDPENGAHGLARRFGIHYQHIWNILYGRIWKHVLPSLPRRVAGAQRGSRRAIVGHGADQNIIGRQ